MVAGNKQLNWVLLKWRCVRGKEEGGLEGRRHESPTYSCVHCPFIRNTTPPHTKNHMLQARRGRRRGEMGLKLIIKQNNRLTVITEYYNKTGKLINKSTRTSMLRNSSGFDENNDSYEI